MLNRTKYSFPVGKVKMLNLYPLDFEEYLWALDKNLLTSKIRECYINNIPMPPNIHEESMLLYKKYTMIGSMLAAILEYINTGKQSKVLDVQESILASYMSDISKYATRSESIKISGSFDSMPIQLAKENKKFQYKLIRKGATANLFGESIEWLISAGIVFKCEKVEQGRVSLEVFKNVSSFKLYMSDVGLYGAKAKIQKENIIFGNLSSDLKGAITENFVSQNLIANKHDIYYWEYKSQAEVDFVILDSSGNIIPIEVNYDLNTRSRSLCNFSIKYECKYAIRISGKSFGFENNIKSVPLYAVFCI